MRHRFSAHFRLLWLYSRRCILYNLFLSVLGASSLFAVSLATGDGAQPLPAMVARAIRVASLMGAILVMTGGQALALVAMRLFHGKELPYYRNAGFGEGALAAGSWVAALAVGALLMVAWMIWT